MESRESCLLNMAHNADGFRMSKNINSTNKEEETNEEATARRLKQRREARRKRILDNAKIRLEKLNGRASGDFTTIAGLENELNREYSDPEVEPNAIQEEIPEIHNLSFLNENNSFFDQNEANSTIKKKPFFMECRVHILFVAAIAFICTVVFGDGSITFSLFIPVSLCIIAEKCYYKDQQQQLSPSIVLLTALGGLDPHRGSPLIMKALRLVSSVQNLIFDIGIVIFFAVIITYTLSSISYIFVHLGKIK